MALVRSSNGGEKRSQANLRGENSLFANSKGGRRGDRRPTLEQKRKGGELRMAIGVDPCARRDRQRSRYENGAAGKSPKLQDEAGEKGQRRENQRR